MCVAQFRDYCAAHSSKLIKECKHQDEIQWNRKPYKSKQGFLYYTKNLKKIKQLAASGNEYAIKDQDK